MKTRQIDVLDKSFRQFRGDVAILVFLKTMASYNPTSLTPSLVTEVPVLSQESEQSCICVLEVMYLCVSGHVYVC
jgi:hypothetical protein